MRPVDAGRLRSWRYDREGRNRKTTVAKTPPKTKTPLRSTIANPREVVRTLSYPP
jgi:hypothetical protein